MTGASSHISVEFGHVHLPSLDEREAESAAAAAKRWAMPVVDAYEQAGLTASTVVMLDDYFAPSSTDVDAGAELLRQACKAAGVRIDHIARETACAASVSRMHERLGPQYLHWLDNGEPVRKDPSDGRNSGQVHRPRGSHAIHLDVQLRGAGHDTGAMKWACPTLSAWWQLMRLGMFEDDRGMPAAPPHTQSRPGAPPFVARRTLTLLEPRFIEVEHAVRVILEKVKLPKAWRRRLREDDRGTSQHEHLERIVYMFVPTGF